MFEEPVCLTKGLAPSNRAFGFHNRTGIVSSAFLNHLAAKGRRLPSKMGGLQCRMEEGIF